MSEDQPYRPYRASTIIERIKAYRGQHGAVNEHMAVLAEEVAALNDLLAPAIEAFLGTQVHADIAKVALNLYIEVRFDADTMNYIVALNLPTEESAGRVTRHLDARYRDAKDALAHAQAFASALGLKQRDRTHAGIIVFTRDP